MTSVFQPVLAYQSFINEGGSIDLAGFQQLSEMAESLAEACHVPLGTFSRPGTYRTRHDGTFQSTNPTERSLLYTWQRLCVVKDQAWHMSKLYREFDAMNRRLQSLRQARLRRESTRQEVERFLNRLSSRRSRDNGGFGDLLTARSVTVVPFPLDLDREGVSGLGRPTTATFTRTDPRPRWGPSISELERVSWVLGSTRFPSGSPRRPHRRTDRSDH